MIFNEDAILLSFLERFDDEEEIKDAVISYCNRGAVQSSTGKRGGGGAEQMQGLTMMSQAQPTQSTPSTSDSSELDQQTSPIDGALDFMKKKRLNQMAAKQQQQ